MNMTQLPSIERWWPGLDIPAKRWLLEHPEEPLPVHIVTEISLLCNLEITPEGEITLTTAEHNFITTQMESVD
ncbi:hypothetical protein AB4Y63_03785 [Leifsonia sp. YAF41]|uniref:hypothetical protein n=1 Tax=Leifsonia sp. YAF41 TaxID=3233086 RepID=UPI003F94D0B9